MLTITTIAYWIQTGIIWISQPYLWLALLGVVWGWVTLRGAFQKSVTARPSRWSPYDLPVPLLLVWWFGRVLVTARRMERVYPK